MAEKHLIGKEELQRAFRSLRERDIPGVMHRTINAIADEAKESSTRRIGATFHNARAFTKRAVYTRKARRKDLTAFVGIKDKQARYLRVHETGGGRSHTRFEKRLQTAGALKPGEFVVPAGDVKITRGIYTQILSQLGGLHQYDRASSSARSVRNRRRSGTFFIPPEPGIGAGTGLPRGIWRRKGIFIEPVFWITSKRPQYAAELRFEETTRKVFNRRLVSIARKEAAKTLRRNRERGYQ